MKVLSIAGIAAIFVCLSCGSDSPDRSKPAITGIPTPFYDGMAAATMGQISITLPPQKIVYILNNTMTVNDVRFVGVALGGDTTGYVPDGWLLRQGQAAVLQGHTKVSVYSDSLGQNPVNEYAGWNVVSVGTADGTLTKVLYAVEGKPTFGFVDSKNISTDPTDVAYLQAAIRNGTDSDDQLSSRQWKLRTPDKEIAQNASSDGSEKVDDFGHVSMRWTDKNGKPAKKEDVPGEFILSYVFDDGSESAGHHLGDTLDNGYPRCVKSPDRSALKYKLQFMPFDAMDFTMLTEIDLDDAFGGDGHYEQAFPGAKPQKLYKYIVEYENASYVTCGDAKFTVTTSTGYTGTGVVYASCGD